MFKLTLHASPTFALEKVLADRHVAAPRGWSADRQLSRPPIKVLFLPGTVHKPTVRPPTAGVLKIVTKDDIHGGIWWRMPVAAVGPAFADITQKVTANAQSMAADPYCASDVNSNVSFRSGRLAVLVGAHLPTTTTTLPALLFGRFRHISVFGV